MKMYKLAIVLTIATVMLGGCATSSDLALMRSIHNLPDTPQGNQLAKHHWGKFVGAAFEKGFNRGMSRGLTRSPVRYGTIKSKVRLSDGRVLRSKTKYRTGGWRKTKIETEYY